MVQTLVISDFGFNLKSTRVLIMKLKRTTWILILLALSLGGFVYFYEIKGAPQREAAQAKQKEIFSFEKDQIQALTVKSQEQTLKFERVTQEAVDKTSISQWQMKSPSDVPASDPSVSYLLNLLVDGKSDRTLSIFPNQLQEYGLDKPQATVEVRLNNQQTHQIILGKPNFNSSFLYAQVDPPAQTPQQLEVLLVPIDFEYGVKRPLSEWKAKEAVQKNSPDKTSDKATPSQSPQPSPSSSPASKKDTSGKNSDKATPSQSPQPSPSPSPEIKKDTSGKNSDKATPSQSNKPSPSPSPKTTKNQPAEKATPSKSDKPSPSPSPASQKDTLDKKPDKAIPAKSPQPSPSPSPKNSKTETLKTEKSPQPSPSPSP
ncbi:DUF4340 domain-containing protein [Coleofasciculus sp. FACHB-129]|uniref:DUF4340 domain-containing protein n=2 Tax=Cyanobacteriota TaxID=1117 RepID=UPI00321FFFA6